MKILIVTGKLASKLVKKVSSKSKHDIKVLTVETPIAAFLTPSRIIEELKKISEEKLRSREMIITPGLIRKNVSPIKDKTSIPTYKGPKDAADLGIVLEMVEKLDLSPKIPADKLIEDELRRRALEFIENFENDAENREKLLKKEENILVRELPVGQDFPQRVLAEIANAPILSRRELVERAEYFLKSGADMLDLGMIAGENQAHRIPDMVQTLRKHAENIPVSIDTLNPDEIKVAVEAGVDMVLSLDHGNVEETLPLLQEAEIPAVILPTDYSQNWVPATIEERVESLTRLRQKCVGIDVIADLILDPINSSSLVESIISCHQYKKFNQTPLFLGVGNVTELLDTDSVGVNALLSGIAMELGASILFTTEESGKTKGSVKELAVSSKMMFLAKNRGSIPKDLGINLLVFKDKGKGEKVSEEIQVPVVQGEIDRNFKQDPAGSFKITVLKGRIMAVHYLNTEPQLAITAQTAKEVYDEILKRKLISRMEHATYLGAELEKAEIALKLGKNYFQDFPLFKRFI